MASLLEPGDLVIVGVNGYFGQRLVAVAKRLGAEIETVEAPWGQPVEPQRLLEAQRNRPQARLVAVVHAETSTEIAQRCGAIACAPGHRHPAAAGHGDLSGQDSVEIDGWSVDAAYSATQKCLGAPSGLSPVILSDRGMHRVRFR